MTSIFAKPILLTVDDQASIYEDIALQSERKKLLTELMNTTQCYKVIIAIGMIASVSVIAQSQLCNLGGMTLLVDCLSNHKESNKISIWSLWTLTACIITIAIVFDLMNFVYLQHLTFQHPSCKLEFFVKGGIPIVLSSMTFHMDSLEVNSQGFIFLYSLLLPDGMTKFHGNTLRTQVFANGITKLIQNAKRKFKSDNHLIEVINNFQNNVLSSWL